MTVPLVFFLGIRLSALSSVNRFVSLSCRLAVVGIMLGVATLISVLSVMKGFDAEIRQSIVNRSDHLQVYAFNHFYPESLYEELGNMDHVVSVTGYAQTYGLVQVNKQYQPILLSMFVGKEVEGIQLSGMNLYRFSSGKPVTVILPEEKRMMPRTVSLTYTGEYTDIAPQRGILYGVVSEGTYQNITGKHNLTGLLIEVDDLYATSEIKAYLKNRYQGLYQGFDWKDKYQAVFSALRMQRVVMIFVLSMITLVALFSLISGLVMLSSDRAGEIALLRAMGLTKSQVKKIFLIQGAYIGLIGILFGVCLGLLLSYFAGDIAAMLEGLLGIRLVDERVYGITRLPTQIEPKMVIGIALAGFVASMLAALYPASKAASLDPVEVLRHG